MKKLLTIALLSSALYAENFKHFLQKAVDGSPLLQASRLQIEQTSEAGSALTRYQNPNLELEASYFNPDTVDGDFGFRAAYAQPVRLWGVGNDKESLANANVDLAKADYSEMKASFVRDISLQYTNYAQNSLLQTLAQEELELSKTIYNISKERYEAGTISRGIMLQAQVDFKMIQARVQTLALVRQRDYYELLKSAGIKEDLEIDTDHTFVLSTKYRTNPRLLQLEKRQKSAVATAKVNTNKVEWMSLAGEYEKEPDQDIFRFGASIPLAFFNTKTQEKRIATLEATRSEMLTQNAQSQLDVELRRLAYESEALRNLQTIDEDILESEKELLSMYEDGYKIANVNLLALQDAKRRLIETKERLIRIKIELDRNVIIYNYLQGTYND